MNTEVRLNDIQLDVLKFMYENNARISKLGGYTKAKISHRVKSSNDDSKTAIDYLTDINFLIKKKTSHKSEPSSYGIQGSYKTQKRTVTEEKYRIAPLGIKYYEEEIATMEITEQLKKEIDEDISKLDNATAEEARNIYNKYKNHIDGVSKIVVYSGVPVAQLKSVLEGFKLFGYRNKEELITDNSTSINISNENVNKNTIQIDITFEEVKDDINKNSYLSEETIEEIIAKIEELEKVYKESDTSKNKWNKVKSILSWLSTKGVDIAIKIMPLILKVLIE